MKIKPYPPVGSNSAKLNRRQVLSDVLHPPGTASGSFLGDYIEGALNIKFGQVSGAVLLEL